MMITDVINKNSKSIKDLNIDYTPVNKSAVDFFQQFIDEKII